jgi:integrase
MSDNNVSKNKQRGGWVYQVESLIDGKRKKKSFKSKTVADEFARHANALRFAKVTDTTVPAKTLKWVSKQSQDTIKKLASLGFWEDDRESIPTRFDDFVAYFVSQKKSLPRKAEIVSERFSQYLAQDHKFTDSKGETRTVKGRKNPLLSSITKADAKGFYHWYLENFAQGHANRSMGYMREVFNAAIQNKLVSQNVFVSSDTPATVKAVEEKFRYVTNEESEMILEAIGDDPVAACAFVLMRYLGFRNCSELNALKYCDIDWDAGQIKIWDSKRKRFRYPPILPVIEPFLLRACEAMKPRQTHVLPKTSNKVYRDRYVGKYGNGGYLGKAGIEVWDSLFVQLRKSAAQDLYDLNLGAYVVEEWLGHSPEVSKQFYKRVNRTHYDAVSKLSNPLEAIANVAETPITEAQTQS